MRGALFAAAIALGCAQGAVQQVGDREVPHRPIEEVAGDYTAAWMALPQVVGVMVGESADGAPCIKVLVVEKTDQLARQIPQQVDGYRVVLEVSGPLRPR